MYNQVGGRGGGGGGGGGKREREGGERIRIVSKLTRSVVTAIF